MDMALSLQGRGTQWQSLSKRLNGQGDMLVSDGRVISPGLVKGLAGFLQLPNMNEIAFSNFKGNVIIVDGKVKLDSSINSDEIKLFPKGDIGLDGLLNLSLDTRLSPQVAARLDSRGKVSKYLTDDQGWSQVPLLVTGSYESPSFGLDPKGLKSQAKKALTDKLGKELNKLLGGSDAKQDGTDAAGDDSKADPAGQLLQKLFGN
jgi:AsmA protein